MAFKGNLFALLNDEDDGDCSQLLSPPSAPESRKPLGHNNVVKSERRKGKQTGRGGRERGSVRNNNAQEKGIQNNNYHHSNDNRRYDGGQRQNMGDNGYRKNDDVHEQNNVDKRGYRGANWGSWNNDYNKFVRRGDGEVKTYEGKEAVGGNEEPRKGNLIVGVSKGREPEQIPNGGKGFSEQKRQDNTMTLQQYDKQLLEKRKALEAFKKEERKVTLDEELDSMQLVGKKKDDAASAKQNSETEKLKKDDGLGTTNEKVGWVSGRHAIFDKDARVPLAYRRYTRPATTTTKDEALKAGHSPEVPSKAPESGNSHRNPPVKTPDVEDRKQFPVLERVSKNSNPC
ncbi:RGG repeats nuclear RNA binding protein A-like [Coffea eugenioides]|uniref:RGG repeats nuclear RNA binding protein A-like n=1 Tax=Coffea eugenioides TaxID=49369 RepID=UPI000F605AD2|nr:RGG repeats nuclear RNA binding protein A-like [Coffea eugenioides]